MNLDLNQYLDILKLIINFIEKNKLADEKSKELKYLKDICNQLQTSTINVISFDFDTIKKKVNKFIHPDVISDVIKEDTLLFAESQKYLKKFNEILNNIIKAKRQMINDGVTEYVWTYSGSRNSQSADTSATSKNSGGYSNTPHSESSNTPNRNSNSTSSNSSTYSSPNYSQDYESSENEPFEEPTLFKTFNDFLYFLCHHDPLNSEEYFKMKRLFESRIAKLNEELADKGRAIQDCDKKIFELREQRSRDLSKENIDFLINQEIEDLQQKIDKLEQQRKILIEKLKKVEARLDGEIRRRVDYLFTCMQYVYADYRNLQGAFVINPDMVNLPCIKSCIQMLIKLDPELASQYFDFRNIFTYNQLFQYCNELLAKYPNIDTIKRIEKERIYSDPEYTQLYSEIRNLELQKKELLKKMFNLHLNDQEARISAEVNDFYASRLNELIRRRNQISHKWSRTKKRSVKLKNSYDDFIRQYQYIYELRRQRKNR